MILTILKNKIVRVLTIGFALASFSLSVAALNLDQARAQGAVKESPNGYLTVVKPSSEVNKLVEKINAGRKAEYKKIAKKRGTSLQAVEQLAGKKLSK